jgi:hypothetical protein
MVGKKKATKSLWTQSSLTPSIQAYFDAYMGEFSTDWVQSDYPYKGKSSLEFRRISKVDRYDEDIRFVGKGIGCWTLKKDYSLGGLTADLLAASDILRSIPEREDSSSLPGGIGADLSKIWTSLLDGGVGVSVLLCEHQTTNRVSVKHRTTIRGPKAFRVLTQFLGFEWNNRKIYGEKEKPSFQEIKECIEQLRLTS